MRDRPQRIGAFSIRGQKESTKMTQNFTQKTLAMVPTVAVQPTPRKLSIALAHVFVGALFDGYTIRSKSAFLLRRSAASNVIQAVGAAIVPDWTTVGASFSMGFVDEINKLTVSYDNGIKRSSSSLYEVAEGYDDNGVDGLAESFVLAMNRAAREESRILQSSVTEMVLDIISEYSDAQPVETDAIPAPAPAPVPAPVPSRPDPVVPPLAAVILAILHDRSRFTKRSKCGLRNALIERGVQPTDAQLVATLNALVNDRYVREHASVDHGVLYSAQ